MANAVDPSPKDIDIWRIMLVAIFPLKSWLCTMTAVMKQPRDGLDERSHLPSASHS